MGILSSGYVKIAIENGDLIAILTMLLKMVVIPNSYHLVNIQKAIENGGSFYSYVSLPLVMTKIAIETEALGIYANIKGVY